MRPPTGVSPNPSGRPMSGVALVGAFWLYPRDFKPGVRWARQNPIEVLSMTALGLIVVCGLLAIVYGVWAIWSVMQANAGSAKMQEIAAAVREGAQAYLKRQYTTIGVVGHPSRSAS